MAVDIRVQGEHVDGIVVEQLQLGGKFRYVVPCAGACSEQLHPAATEAGEHGLASCASRVGDFVAFVKDQLDIPAQAAYVLFNLLFVAADNVQGEEDEVSGLDPFQVLQLLHKEIGQAVVVQHHVPVVADLSEC